MLSYFMVYLPDRYDHHVRLLPYVLSLINDAIPNIWEAALDCVCLMGKYVDPAVYLPLLCPRISGEYSERERRNYAMVLSSLIDGSTIQRLNLHWSDLATLLSSPDCIGPFVGTQTRRQCLTALRKLIAAVESEGRTEIFISHHADA